MAAVLIRGDGIAACCCAHLLKNAGIPVAMELCPRAKVPALMLSDASQALISDVFEQPDLFRDSLRVTTRMVRWGGNAQPIPVAHSAAVVSEQKLSERVRPDVPIFEPAVDSPAWTIHSAPPVPTTEHRFGTRIAAAVPVSLKSDPHACWIESLDSGWLFMIPSADGEGWLLAVGGPVESLLDRSRLIASQIAGPVRAAGQFPAFPRISDPLCQPGWLACGTTAMSFDPLCGDGTGHAVREAILAAAVIRAALDGREPLESLLDHYRARLIAGFYRHLELCREFYNKGRSGPWWEGELEHLTKGIAYCQSAMTQGMRFRYQLTGFTLQAVP
jgi:hypothetical protein